MVFLILYVVVLLGFGFFEFKKVKNFDDFIISGRTQRTGAIAYSILATCIGASATLGVVSTARNIGFPAFWWLGAGAVGLLLQSLFLSRNVRAVGAYTLPDLTEKLMGRYAGFLTSIIVVIAWTGIIVAQFVAGANGIMTGNYLTTKGSQEDLEMINQLGFTTRLGSTRL